MTKSTGEKPRSRSRVQRIREDIQLRSLKAKKKVEDITKDDVKTFLRRHAFVLFTIGAVALGKYNFPFIPKLIHLKIKSFNWHI